jgi:hypothetical protein
MARAEDILAMAGVTREQLGREVRRVWTGWAECQPDPKPSWLVPFDELTAADQEADMRIGQVLFLAGWRARGLEPGDLFEPVPYSAYVDRDNVGRRPAD